MGTIGPRLRAAREARNLTVERAADDTRISLRFLEALEREEFDALPAPVYVRGFLRSYANYLGLEPQTLLDELEGDNAVSSPAPYVRGPSGREQRTAAPPAAAEAVLPIRPEAAEQTEWDPEPGADGWDDDGYADGPSDYRAQPVPGVLVERRYNGGDSGAPRAAMLIGIGLIVVFVVVLAAMALNGGDGNVPAGGIGGDDTPIPTTSNGGRTVIPVGTGTVEGTPGGGGDGTPAATTDPDATTEPGTTPEPTPTGEEGETPDPDATETPTEAATATNTVAPPTATATSVPPTATPTLSPTPVPTPTVQPHPFELAECTAGGGTNCGTPPYRVICAPDGWFVDKDNDYPKPGDWPEFTVNTTLGIDSVASAQCAS